MMRPALHRFVVADDHPLFRDALRQTVAAAYPGAAIEEAGTLDDVAARLAAGADTDLVLLDLGMPGMRGFSGLVYLRAQFPEVPVLVVSGSEDPGLMRQAVAIGAAGYIPKSLGVEAIRTAIGAVLAGGVWLPPQLGPAPRDETADLVRRMATLTPQQVRVLMMLTEGLLNKQIAFALGVSEATVKAHVSAILQKLGVDSRTQAVIAASKLETAAAGAG
ncbi:DNA-binding NarL/FixJ family response regulator [Prosthecomicrobium pneumaticum]|uniref:DNA-binding NarL/FixJ family response regulator n=2 Tax=Prosthecomicrobium pneumaticum TaxID=81895 RepID=A0A7W9FMG8_9HYPH|nr:DNA-binding NarL/FixJ family response regulator [Prosthecomicrobium pneumaticum]